MLFSGANKNDSFSNNKSYNSPFSGLFGIATGNTEAERTVTGVVFRHNEIYNCAGSCILFQGNGLIADENIFIDCSGPELGTFYGDCVSLRGGKIEVTKNKFRYSKGGLVNYRAKGLISNTSASDQTDLLVSDNEWIGFYVGSVFSKNTEAVRVHGTDVGVDLPLLNGWVSTGSGDRPLRAYRDCAGKVSIVGNLSGAASTADDCATLPSGYGPAGNAFGFAQAIQTATSGSATAGFVYPLRIAGDRLVLSKLGKNASYAAFSFTYQATGNLW